MAKSPSPTLSDSAIQALLAKYHCPTPFPAVRAIFMGAIASPELRVSPMATLQSLWNGELPEFESTDDVQALADALVSGLWNRLTRHQDSRTPFRLIRDVVAVARAELLALARMRAQELAGFVDGLFGNAERLDLPEKAHQAVARLAELQGMFEASTVLLADESRSGSQQDLREYARNAQEMTRIAEDLINKTIQSCKRARAGHLETMAAQPTSKHGAGGYVDEPPFVESPLSQRITRRGVTVEAQIYSDGNDQWILEIVDGGGTSHVWDEHFTTDQGALDEAIRALEADPMEFAGEAKGEHGAH